MIPCNLREKEGEKMITEIHLALALGKGEETGQFCRSLTAILVESVNELQTQGETLSPRNKVKCCSGISFVFYKIKLA